MGLVFLVFIIVLPIVALNRVYSLEDRVEALEKKIEELKDSEKED